jgi:hypothetical protein
MLAIHRKTFLLLVVFLLISPWASAASSQPNRSWGAQTVEETSPPLVGRFLSLLRGVWGKAGCNIDPLGRCISPPAQTKAGCHPDPWGRCIP